MLAVAWAFCRPSSSAKVLSRSATVRRASASTGEGGMALYALLLFPVAASEVGSTHCFGLVLALPFEVALGEVELFEGVENRDGGSTHAFSGVVTESFWTWGSAGARTCGLLPCGHAVVGVEGDATAP